MAGTINWSDLVKDASSGSGGSFEPLPAGDYNIKVVEANATTSSSGKTMFKVKAEVQDGPSKGRLLWDNLVISPENANALGFFFRKMKALGLGSEFFSTNPSNAQIEQALVNRQARAKVIIRTYNGNTSNNIENYFPVQTPGAPGGFPGQAPQAAPAPQGAPQQQYAPPAPAAPQQGQPQYGAPVAPPAAPQSPWGAPPDAPF